MSGVACAAVSGAPAVRSWRGSALLACALLSLGCGAHEPDATEVCEACVEDGTDALASIAPASPRNVADAPEYAFLQESSLAPSEIEGAWAGLKYERIGLTRTSCFSNCVEIFGSTSRKRSK